MSFHAVLSQAWIRVTTSHARHGTMAALQEFLTPPPPLQSQNYPLTPNALKPGLPRFCFHLSFSSLKDIMFTDRMTRCLWRRACFRSGRVPEGPRAWRGCPVSRCIPFHVPHTMAQCGNHSPPKGHLGCSGSLQTELLGPAVRIGFELVFVCLS